MNSKSINRKAHKGLRKERKEKEELTQSYTEAHRVPQRKSN